MKKLIVVATAAVFALALAGCSSGGASSSAANSSASAAASSTSASSSEASVGLANPWTQVATAEEAGEGAGLSDGFTVDESMAIGDLTWREITYTCMKGIAQADFDGGAVEVTIRKGQGLSGQEFTGDYNDYKFTWTSSVMTADNTPVVLMCSGNEEGVANLVEWHISDSSYAAYSVGLGGENYGFKEADLPNLVAAVK